MKPTDQHEQESPTKDEEHISRLLQEVGRREDVPKEMKSRWENGFRQELDLVLNRRRRRRYTYFAIASSFKYLILLFPSFSQ